jgi:hypothetical protein
MRSTVFCSETVRSSAEVHRCFGETYRLLLQDGTIGQTRNQNEAGGMQSFASCWFLTALKTKKIVYFTLTTLGTSYPHRDTLFLTYGLLEKENQLSKSCSGARR